jgi:hypothetical protein
MAIATAKATRATAATSPTTTNASSSWATNTEGARCSDFVRRRTNVIAHPDVIALAQSGSPGSPASDLALDPREC